MSDRIPVSLVLSEVSPSPRPAAAKTMELDYVEIEFRHAKSGSPRN